jgi:hypothetical protein
MTRKELADLPLQSVAAEEKLPQQPSALVMRALATVRDLASREEEQAFGEDSEKDGAKMAWQAWLGYYNGQLRKLNLNKEQLVVKSAEYASTIGLPQIPAMQKKTIGKMGLQVIISFVYNISSAEHPNNDIHVALRLYCREYPVSASRHLAWPRTVVAAVEVAVEETTTAMVSPSNNNSSSLATTEVAGPRLPLMAAAVAEEQTRLSSNSSSSSSSREIAVVMRERPVVVAGKGALKCYNIRARSVKPRPTAAFDLCHLENTCDA